MKPILIALAAALSLAAAARAGDLATVVQGRLQGVTAGAVTSFKDIPYAAAPVGPLRWRPPQPAAAWPAVRKADAFGPACTQPMGFPMPMSEDCLTLNVWAPATAVPGARLPVMVWIHGGAFVWGAGGTPFYDGTHFAERGVILVTLNYRLGRFGFFAHPALAREEGLTGDYGLMDQVAALKWVQANIAAFGGDPARVTVFGESAGGMSVNYLLTSPMARGLFAQAITESGFARAGAPTLAEAEAVGTRVAAGLGVTGVDAAALAALRALPADRLNAAPTGLDDPLIAGPMIDGKLIVETVKSALAAGREARVPLIVGGNSWEASLFPNVGKNPETVLAKAGARRDALIALYGGGGLGRIATDVTTDAAVIEPDRFEARALTRDGAPAYLYYFSYVPVAQRATQPGAPHGGEVLYVFDNLPPSDLTLGGRHIPAATPEDRKVSEAMIDAWTTFAKTGSPGQGWPRYTLATDTALEFGVDGVAPRPAFRKAKLDVLEAVAK